MTLFRRDFLGLAGAVLVFAGGTQAALAAGADDKGYATGDMALGADDAPITIIEYASMTCPHCANFHKNTFPQLKAEYVDTGKARFIYREFPFDQLGLRAAMVARCAGPKRFFAFIDVLFRQQASWAGAPDPLDALARLARVGGMSRADFDACMADQALMDEILRSRLEGNAEFGINSTPSFIINGAKHSGNMSFAKFDTLLKPLLPAD